MSIEGMPLRLSVRNPSFGHRQTNVNNYHSGLPLNIIRLLMLVLMFCFHVIRLFAPSSPSKHASDAALSSVMASGYGDSTSTTGHKDPDPAKSASDVDDDWRHRMELFDLLVAYYPEYMTQPKQNLVDLVAL